MTVQAYRTQPFETTHENRIFDALLNELERVWSDSEDFVLLLGNFYCHGSEIDAAILKKNSITVIDFKDYGGNISFSENGAWFADDVEVKGGSKQNPFIQIRDNKYALKNALERIKLPSSRYLDLKYISGLVLFHKPIIFDERQLPPNIERWFHIVDFDRIIERLSQITCREISLSNRDLETIVKALNIPEYIPIGSSIKAVSLEEKANLTNLEFPDSLNSALSTIVTFLDSSERILIIAGMIGTGLEQLLELIKDETVERGRNYSVLVPNRRITLKYAGEVDSIYTYIYSRNYKIEKEQFIYSLTDEEDPENHLYIISEAHLISDSLFETEFVRYGSGQLLRDFLSFTNLKGSKKQIIFLGDPFQIIRGKADESALCNERLQAITGFQANKISLEYLLPGKQEDVVVNNCLKLATSINKKVFNHLQLIIDNERLIKAPSQKEDKYQLLIDIFSKAPKTTKFVAFDNEAVNRLNSWIRKKVFQFGEAISPGDIVHIREGFFIANDDELERPSYIQNDLFAEVISVNENVEPLEQPLQGRDKPIAVPFLQIRARLLQNDREIEFLCLKNYLYAEKPEVDRETFLALYISAKRRFCQARNVNIANAEAEETDCFNSLDFAKFLQNDPFFNAARLRFGYALTLHRAQGQQFKTIIANLDIGQGQTNEAYFRWVYTLFSIVRERLIVSNVPASGLLSKAHWDESQARIDTIRPRDLIVFDPDAEAGLRDIPDFPTPEKSLRNLYWSIINSLSPQQIRVKSCKHLNYQEIYGFESENGQASCSLRLHYNKKFRVTRIETVESDPTEFADRVRDILTSNVRLETEFQKQVYDLIKEKLDPYNISIRGIDRHNFQEVYYLRSANGDVKLQIFYDGDGFVTKIALVGYSHLEAVAAVRTALEI